MIRKTLWGGYLVLLTAALFSTFRSYPLPEFQSKVIALTFACFFLFALTGLGYFLSMSLGWRLWDRLNATPAPIKFLACLGIGYSILSSVILGFGWFLPGRLHAVLTILVLILGASAVAFLRTGEIQNMVQEISWPQFTSKELLLLLPAFLGLGASLLTCFSPITYYDSLVYHLALPKYYLLNNAITGVPFNLYSFFPQSTEMVSSLILGKFMEPEYVINLVTWAFSLGASFLIAQWALDVAGRKGALIGFVLWWTCPAVLFLSIGAYVEIPLAFFTILSVRSFSFWTKKKTESDWLFLSGFFSGVCLSIKYTGGITCAVLFVAAVFYSRSKMRLQFKTATVVLGAALVAPSLWLLKNYAAIGNPVFPFFYRWMGYGQVGWTGESAASYFRMLTEYGAKSAVFFELLLAPWRIIHSNLKFGGGFDVLGDFGWLPIIFTVPLYFMLRFSRNALRFVVFYSLIHFALWFCTKPVLRFLVPVLPVMIVVSAAVFERLFRVRYAITKLVVVAVFAFCLLLNFSIYFLIGSDLGSFRVATGIEDRSDFLRRKLPYFLSFEIADRRNSERRTILVLGEQRTYHLNTPYLSSNLFAPSLIAGICNRARSDADIAEFLKAHNIGLVLINYKEIERLGGFEKFGFSTEGFQRLMAFLNHNMVLESDINSIRIFTLS